MFKEIDEDLGESLKLLKNRFGKKISGEIYSSYFNKLFWYRKFNLFLLDNESRFNFTISQKEGLKKTNDSIQDYIEFIWVVYFGRFKVAMSCVRNAVDLNGRAVSLLSDNQESNSFSNNINIVTKNIRMKNELYLNDNIEKKQHKKFLNDNFNEKYIGVYRKLSGVVHGRNEIVENVNGYLSNCIDSIDNVEDSDIEKYVKEAEEALSLTIQYYVLVNYQYLSKNYNEYEFNLILDMFPDDFKEYKRYYLLN